MEKLKQGALRRLLLLAVLIGLFSMQAVVQPNMALANEAPQAASPSSESSTKADASVTGADVMFFTGLD